MCFAVQLFLWHDLQLTDICTYQGKITSQVVKSGYQTDMKLENIVVFGVKNGGPGEVTVNGQKAVFQYNSDTEVFHSLADQRVFTVLLYSQQTLRKL